MAGHRAFPAAVEAVSSRGTLRGAGAAYSNAPEPTDPAENSIRGGTAATLIPRAAAFGYT